MHCRIPDALLVNARRGHHALAKLRHANEIVGAVVVRLAYIAVDLARIAGLADAFVVARRARALVLASRALALSISGVVAAVTALAARATVTHVAYTLVARTRACAGERAAALLALLGRLVVIGDAIDATHARERRARFVIVVAIGAFAAEHAAAERARLRIGHQQAQCLALEIRSEKTACALILRVPRADVFVNAIRSRAAKRTAAVVEARLGAWHVETLVVTATRAPVLVAHVGQLTCRAGADIASALELTLNVAVDDVDVEAAALSAEATGRRTASTCVGAT